MKIHEQVLRALCRSHTAALAELFGSCGGQEVFVIATGPSLELLFDRLRAIREQAARPVFICVATAYRPLFNHGIRPDVVASIDQRISVRHLPPEGTYAITLAYMSMVDPLMFGACRGGVIPAIPPARFINSCFSNGSGANFMWAVA